MWEGAGAPPQRRVGRTLTGGVWRERCGGRAGGGQVTRDVLAALAALHVRGVAVAGLDADSVQVAAAKQEDGSRTWTATLTAFDQLARFTPGAAAACCDLGDAGGACTYRSRLQVAGRCGHAHCGAVLHPNSQGGQSCGCFQTVRELRLRLAQASAS